MNKGDILFNGKSVIGLEMDERAKMGITLGYQNPPEIHGIKLKDLLKICLNKDRKESFSKDELDIIDRFKLTQFLERDINFGFSGGERKRSEVLQMLFLKPKLLLLDEPDSGVDVESLKFIASEIQNYIKSSNASAIIVTHHGEILNYIKAKKALVLLEKNIHCFPRPEEIFKKIQELGYYGCIECDHRVHCERTNDFCKKDE